MRCFEHSVSITHDSGHK